MFKLNFGKNSNYKRVPQSFYANTVIKTNLIFNRVVMNNPSVFGYCTTVLTTGLGEWS